jgi:hypothetical protein
LERVGAHKSSEAWNGVTLGGCSAGFTTFQQRVPDSAHCSSSRCYGMVKVVSGEPLLGSRRMDMKSVCKDHKLIGDLDFAL